MLSDQLKIVVFGAFGAGKTTLIRTLDPASTHIEAPCAGGTTTIALDYGHVDMGGRHVYLFGTPGQERFEFARDIIGRGMDGAILLIDATCPFDEFVSHLYESLKSSKVPFVVFLNKCDQVGASQDPLKQNISSANVIRASAKNYRESYNAIADFVITLPPGRHGNGHPGL